MNTIVYNIGKEGNDVNIRFYMKYTLNLSSRLIKNAAMDKRIKVNGKVIKLRYTLKEDDVLELIINKEESQNIEPENLNIEVVYEDEDLLIVNKPPYMVVHPSKSHAAGTLANGIMYHFKENRDSSIVRLVSRLDMNTSGLVMIAKNQYAHMTLAKASDENKINKVYLAVIHGKLDPQEGTIDLPIGRMSEDDIKRKVMDEGQRSVTHYKTIDSFEEGSIVELKLETGRTHQIRVHLSHLGHPIYGDTLYGIENDEVISRQALHAYKLELPHPKTGTIIEVCSNIPEDIKKLIECIKK